MAEPEDEIREIGEGDWAGAIALLEDVFGQGAEEARLVATLREEEDIALARIAGPLEAPTGIAIASCMRAPERALGLGPVAVLGPARRRGLGGRLIHAVLDAARQEDWRAIFVFGEPAYYERFGFRVETARPLRSNWPPEYLMGLELKTGALGPDAEGARLAYPTAYASFG